MKSLGEKYRLIDETFPEEKPPLFSDRAIFLFTWFGIVVGIILSLVNAKRAQSADLARKTILVFFSWILMTFSFVAIILANPELRTLLRPISLAATLALAFYLSHENKKIVNSHIIMGGRLAPVWVPLAVTIAMWATCIGSTIAVGLARGWK